MPAEKFLDALRAESTADRFPTVGSTKRNKRRDYLNIPAAFDLEASSWYEGEHIHENKRACMYIWQFGLDGAVCYGRTWAEFVNFIHKLQEILYLTQSRRLVVYVHNIQYDFQFFRKWLEWDDVFLLEKRVPMYALSGGLEFRCSMRLSGGMSLARIGDELRRYKVKKLVGNLDYNLLRTPSTPMSPKELAYCENDIRVLLSYIRCKIEDDGGITKIPYTNTGYVRQRCRESCFTNRVKYKRIMKVLEITPQEYTVMKAVFRGGHVHAGANYVARELSDVASYDITSSYPAVMVLDQFPMGRGIVETQLDSESFNRFLLTDCCAFGVSFYGLRERKTFEHPLSYSKCDIKTIKNEVLDNGRVVSCDFCTTFCTEQDWFIYSDYYEWDRFEVFYFIHYTKGYLPKRLVSSVLDFYADKTQLKGVDGKEDLYMIGKNMLNASFGMMVTDPMKERFEYMYDNYVPSDVTRDEAIEKYNKSYNRFLFYPWGIWVTANARARLFSAISEVGYDFVYADTDSVKFVNYERHKAFFDSYNQEIINAIHRSANHFGISVERYMPKSAKGESKIIGTWEFEGVYDRFKTLGAKRYLTTKGGKDTITVSGVNKVKALDYMSRNGDPYEEFNDGLVIPAEYSGRLVMTALDDEFTCTVVDYTGQVCEVHERSAFHSENSKYEMSMSEDFKRFLERMVTLDAR